MQESDGRFALGPSSQQLTLNGTLLHEVCGAAALADRTSASPLAAVNLFSSLAAFSGSGGQGVYAAANAAQDTAGALLQVHWQCNLATEPFLLC